MDYPPGQETGLRNGDTKTEVETKARELIETVLKSRHVKPPRKGQQSNYVMRYTGKDWIGVPDTLSMDECMRAIQDDPWFEL